MECFNVGAWLKVVSIISSRYFVLAGFTFLLFYILFKNKWQKFRLQNKFPKSVHYYQDVKYSLVSMFIFSSIAYLCMNTFKAYNNVIYAPIDNWYYFAFSFLWMYFLHDAYFYWMHRLMHSPLLYRKVHLIHHKSTNPSPWTAYAFHPLEAIIEAGIVPLIAFTVPVYRNAFFLFMLFQIIYNVYGHLGYELYPKNFNKTILGKWINTGSAHNEHHRSFHGNYGLYTLIWDRLFKTLREDYDTNFKNTTIKDT